MENVVTVVCPPLAHKKYESVAAINFFCDRIISSPELPKFAEMLLENDVAFITP